MRHTNADSSVLHGGDQNMLRGTKKLRRAKFLAGLAAVGTFFAGTSYGEDAQELRERFESQNPQRESGSLNSTEIRLNYFAKTWPDVLNRFAEESGRTLVADRFPTGKFSRRDSRGYSLNEAVRVLNQELEKDHYRLLVKGNFLVLINLASARPEYQRPIIDAGAARAQQPQKTGVAQISGDSRQRAYERATSTIEPAVQNRADSFEAGRSTFATSEPSVAARTQTAFQNRPAQHAFTEQARPASDSSAGIARAGQFNNQHDFNGQRQFSQASRFDEPARFSGARTIARQPEVIQQEQARVAETRSPIPSQKPAQNGYRTLRPGAIRQVGYEGGDQGDAESNVVVRQAFRPMNRPARSLSSLLYGAFRDRAKIVEKGPDGLPSMQVMSGKDDAGNPDVPRPMVVFTIGVDTESNELIVEGPKVEVGRVVRLLERLDAAPTNASEATRVVATDKDAGDVVKTLKPAVDELAQNNPAPGQAPALEVDRKDEAGNPLPDLIGGIRGDVSIEAVEGVLVIKGNQADVDAVMEIIRQIEELSAQTAPDIHLRMLQSVDSQALAELLTTVYAQLNRSRGTNTQEQQLITFFAVGRPNAVLILASSQDLESVLTLVDELDKPVEPQTSFAIFTLKHAIAAQVETTLEDFYSNTGTQGTGQGAAGRIGLSARVKVVTDVRTNTLVVLAQTNDLAEIEKVIMKLDRADSGAVSELKVFELRHAVSEELSQTLQSLIQATINPPQTAQGQGLGGFGGFGGGGTGQSSQVLRDVRSTVLEYLSEGGGASMKYRSGILADIRFNADARSNTILVTAPRESMELIAQLISRLDRPSTSVATIKHFSLKNADATSTSTLLTELFGTETTNQNQQVGVQLAGAENASSIVPLKFSVDTRTNSIVAIGTAEALEIVEALIYRIDQSDIQRRETVIIRMKNSPAADIATAVGTFLASQTEVFQNGDGLISSFELVDREVVIQAEPYTNSLLISATPRYFDRVREMVLQLDQELPQVVIEVMLVEVVLDNQDEFGIELGLQDSILFSRGMTGLSTGTPGFNFNNNGLPNVSAASQRNVAGQALSDFGLGRVNTELGFGGFVLSAGNESVSMLLRALSQQRHVEVLSRPQIRTLDNRPALLRIAQEVPRINGFTTNNNGQVNPVVEQAEAGIILSVTPTISPDGNILMSLTAEKSSIDPTVGVALFRDAQNGDIVSPIKELTQAQSTVVVPDEQTIVLGGLITREITNIERKVPWLGDIPLVGQAFRYDQNSNVRKELLIFLTPRIVKGEAHSEAIKHIEAQRIHFDENGAEEIYGPLYGIPSQNLNWQQDNTPGNNFDLTPTTPGIQMPMPMPAPAEVPGVPTTQNRTEPRSGIRQVNFNAQASEGRATVSRSQYFDRQ